ncbi:MAG: helicase [Candidatus Kapaibacterium sp.]|nr:MAG: helicase [Candidatus Kapabacteria bacterium]
MQPGTVVRCRNRDWILLPSDDDRLALLRPLTGTEEDAVGIIKDLARTIAYSIPTERIEPSTFPLPTPDRIADAESAHLLWQAARLLLRDGAAPFRSLGRISIRPRTYQFVPLLMALRLDPVRLFIADDVGVGKTIEALLVARELYDRGQIRRLCVLCPPALCEQWATELEEKFNLEPVVLRSGTVRLLERQVPPSKSIYQYFPIQVASIDFVKTDRNRYQFLQFCPELVIVDEAHNATSSPSSVQQERHRLLRAVAQDPARHIILLTATPHSGIEDAFRSLLALLNPDFEQWDLAALTDRQRALLARHYVQRTRKNIERDWESERMFPQRIAVDATYDLSEQYRVLFDRTYAFCTELIRSGQALDKRKRRVHTWGALALLRCVMSSPRAALATLNQRSTGLLPEEELEFDTHIFESADDRTDDEAPTPPVEAVEPLLDPSGRQKLRELAAIARELEGSAADTKLARLIELTARLLAEGFHPIIWCRYVATAEYVAEHLHQRLDADVQVTCITGRISDDERRAMIAELDATRPRVLVATDCLSEGVNLQELFTAVVHYDLPWNPNRLEQREGRVDRYGQPAPTVRAVRFYGRDNPIDGVVLEVLLDKARKIHETLGIHVPVPEESDSVLQAVLEALFLRGRLSVQRQQLQLELALPSIGHLHAKWNRDVERERVNRSLFAQRSLKPDEVRRELEATDAVLGDPDAVRHFTLAAAKRLGISIVPDRTNGVFCVQLDSDALVSVPELLRQFLRSRGEPNTGRSAVWRISFHSPTPAGAEYLGRNHPFVVALARYLFEHAFERSESGRHPQAAPLACRAGAIRTRAVPTLTVLLLLRARYLVSEPQSQRPLLAEDVLVSGVRASGELLEPDHARTLLADAMPAANIPTEEKRQLVEYALDLLAAALAPDADPTHRSPSAERLGSQVRDLLHQRAEELADSHRRIRSALGASARAIRITPLLPPDVLGVVVLQPVVQP